MTVQEVMAKLYAWGNLARRKINAKNGAGENQYGVTMGNLRKYAKELGKQHELGMELWHTGNIDAMMLAAMILDAKCLTKEQIVEMVEGVEYFPLIDEFAFNIISDADCVEELRAEWLETPADLPGRTGWALVISDVIEGKASEQQKQTYLDIIERGLQTAPPRKQESMNRALCEIGIRDCAFTERCLEIGERLGVYRDQKVPKGCTSAYAPTWIHVGIQKKKPSAGRGDDVT